MSLRSALMSVFFTFGLTFASQAGEFTLRLMSYNIHGVPIPFGYDHSRYKDIGKILKKMRQKGTAPHILALQESFHSQTAELRKEAGYPYEAVGPSGHGLRFNGGLYILSEFPIQESNVLVFRDCAGWDCRVRKGIQHARIKIPGVPVPIDVYNSHLNSDPDSDPITTMEQTLNTRISQIQEMANFIYSTHFQFTPLFFPGDLNIIPGMKRSLPKDYNILTDVLPYEDGVRSCYERDLCSGDPDQGIYWKNSVDHILFSRGEGERVQSRPVTFKKRFTKPYKGRMLSDHKGLEMHFNLVW